MSIRPQYHIRPSPQGPLAWDVRKLIAYAQALQLQPRLVPLSAIAELDQRYRFSEPGDEPTPRAIAQHMRLVEAADTAYPILLDAEGRLMDGMHRIVKAVLAGHSHIAAQRLPHTSAPDYINVDVDSLPYGDEAAVSTAVGFVHIGMT